MIIKPINDPIQLQNDIDRVNEWCIANGLKFSILKCCCISFCKKEAIEFEYTINNESLNIVTSVKDLGVTFEYNRNVSSHVRNIVNKAFKNLYFILRFSRVFKNQETISMIYLVLVRSVLTYASVIWSPSTIKYSSMMESVQHRFLRSLAFRINKSMDRFDHDYCNIASKSKICTVETFRDYQDVLFLYKIIRGYINSLILPRINFRVPGRILRAYRCFCKRSEKVKHINTRFSNRKKFSIV